MEKVIHTFPKSIRSKVNVIAQQEFELAFFEAAGTSMKTNLEYTCWVFRGLLYIYNAAKKLNKF